MVMKCSIFWDITLCSPLKVNLRFGGIYRLNFQGGRKADQETSVKANGKQSITFFFLLRLFLDPEDRGDMFLHVWLTFKGLHSVISQKILLFSTFRDYLFVLKYDGLHARGSRQHMILVGFRRSI
jgi:hypothetical protein